MTPRLYIDAPLGPDALIALSAEQAHYLGNVLRRAPGDALLVFNGADGEFAATIEDLRKKGGAARLGAQTRAPAPEPALTLCFAPVKRGPLETIVQKAVEIGVSRLVPVVTERTAAPKPNLERLRAIALEAAEQCGRLSVPSVDEPVRLPALLERWPDGARLLFCDEAGDEPGAEWGGRAGRAAPLLEALNAVDSKSHEWGVLTGPEGGFSPEERQQLRAKSFVTAATLGPRILRADTAAIAALALWQAALGDWRSP